MREVDLTGVFEAHREHVQFGAKHRPSVLFKLSMVLIALIVVSCYASLVLGATTTGVSAF